MSTGAVHPHATGDHGLAPGVTPLGVERRVIRMPFSYQRPSWWAVFGIALGLSLMMQVAIVWLLARGVGVWGINQPVAWGFAITNFVWWIGIGHAGTLISAILLLCRQRWRTTINRFAEAMTLFAVANAALFPLLHLGRVWKFYYILPYWPNTLDLWPQWRSPLVWDAFAVMTYGLVSLLFWYIGMIPDLAVMRERAPGREQRLFFGVLALGWRGSARHWRHHQSAYLMLAGLATPLVVSVHSIVSFDFAVAILPGWHSTFFAPYFVAGAIFSGFAMVFTLCIPLRWHYGLHELITEDHLNKMAKVMLTAEIIVAYSYVVEIFNAMFSADVYEQSTTLDRLGGFYAGRFWVLVLCVIVLPQLLWSHRVRTNAAALFVLSILFNVGMWLERYIIIVTSLYRDYLPGSWGVFEGTLWDWALLIGTLGFFALLFMLFLRLLPAISMDESKGLIWSSARKKGGEA